MLVKQPLSDQYIIDSLNTHYNIDVLTLRLLSLGADMDASVYKAETQHQSTYFIKLKRGHHHEIGIDVVELLHNAGIQQIIPPIKTIHGQPTQHIDDFTLIVYPFIEGQDGFSRTLTDEQWMTLGKALKQIHEIDVPSSIQHRVRRESYSSKWREIVRSLYAQIEAKFVGDEIGLKLQAFMKEHTLVIHRLVNRAEQLAQLLQNKPSKFVLCHSDIHGGNVLIDKKNSIYIVDWDEPIMAPKERDLMFIGGGVGNVWNNAQEEMHFYKGYGKTDVNVTILAYYRHERIVEDIALYGQSLLLTTSGGEDRQVMLQHFLAMFERNGVLEIAFKSDKDV